MTTYSLSQLKERSIAMKRVLLFSAALILLSCSNYSANRYFKKGNEHYKLGNYEMAKVNYTKAIDADPHFYKAYLMRGIFEYMDWLHSLGASNSPEYFMSGWDNISEKDRSNMPMMTNDWSIAYKLNQEKTNTFFKKLPQYKDKGVITLITDL